MSYKAGLVLLLSLSFGACRQKAVEEHAEMSHDSNTYMLDKKSSHSVMSGGILRFTPLALAGMIGGVYASKAVYEDEVEPASEHPLVQPIVESAPPIRGLIAKIGPEVGMLDTHKVASKVYALTDPMVCESVSEVAMPMSSVSGMESSLTLTLCKEITKHDRFTL